MNSISNKKMMARGVAAIAATAFLTAPAAAAAQLSKGDELQEHQKNYLEIRQDFVESNGVEAAGRNIVRYGFLKSNGDVRDATKAEVRRSSDLMAPVPAPAPETGASDPVTAAPTASGGGSMNATVICESGGDYSINTGNGYYGGYQFDSGTWDAYGDPAYEEAHLAPPAVQDAAAAAVPYNAWPNCP